MYKKILLSFGLVLGILLISSQQQISARAIDSTTFKQYKPFHWEIISNMPSIEDIKDLSLQEKKQF